MRVHGPAATVVMIGIALALSIGSTHLGAQERTGGTVVLAVGGEWPSLNPVTHFASDIRYNANLAFDGLTRIGRALEAEPDLAESWTVSPDQKRYTFRLRRGVKWHDGQPFTARDVKFSWEVICHPENRVSIEAFANHFQFIQGASEFREGKAGDVTGIKVVDDYTLEVTLAEPYAAFLVSTAQTGIVPQHLLKDVPVAALPRHPFSQKPIGTGPFRVVERRMGYGTTYEANRDYHGGVPAIDRLIVRIIADAETRLAALVRGEIDMNGLYAGPPAQRFDDLTRNPAVVTKRYAGFMNQYIDFNVTHPFYQDVRVRRALAMAIDRKGVLENLYFGRGQIVDSLFHPRSWAFRRDLPSYDYNPDRAKALLSEAGWRPGPDGILVKDGQRFATEMITFVGIDTLAQVVQDSWRKVGVEVRLKRVDFITYWTRAYTRGNFEVANGQWPIGLYVDPDVGLYGYLSHTSRNSYGNPRVDELIRRGAVATSRAERKKYYDEVQEILARDLPRFWMVLPDELWAMSPRITLPDVDNTLALMKLAPTWAVKR